MSIKMLMFDFREEEQAYFDRENTEDFEITFFKESLTKNVVQNLPYEVRQNTTVISVFIDSKVDKEVIDEFPNLMIISTRSTGFNHIDLEEAKKQNIKVLNVENYGKTSVMQYTFGLILTIMRKIYVAITDMKNLNKGNSKYVGRDLNN